MQQEHGDRLGLEFLREQSAHDVAGGAAHVVAVVAAFRILSEAPLDAAGLARDDDDFGRFLERAGLHQFRGHAQRPDRANVNLLELFLEVERVVEHLFLGTVEVARVVDQEVECPVLFLKRRGEGRNGRQVGHVDAFEGRRDVFQVVPGSAARREDSGAALFGALRDLEAKTPIAARHDHLLARQVRAVEHLLDRQVPQVLLLLRLRKPSPLVRHRKLRRRRIQLRHRLAHALLASEASSPHQCGSVERLRDGQDAHHQQLPLAHQLVAESERSARQ
mmetsp:Transcript_8650/g.26534  ORF Transcript_8650/g.26534 Transcript_8650/m.26534 type:complete len:277 (+) Transcript_8650:686-1516(+)